MHSPIHQSTNDQSQNQSDGLSNQSEDISEALVKSVGERLHRRTRISDPAPSKRDARPVVKKKGDNDPRRTSKGRSNMRGSRKRNRDARKSRDLTEAVGFIERVSGKPVELIIEEASKVVDATPILNLLDTAITRENLSEDHDLTTCFRAVKSVVEAKGVEFGPIFACLNNQDSINEAKAICAERAQEIKKFLPAVWLEQREDKRSNACSFVVVGDTTYTERYSTGLADGSASHI